MVEVRVNGKTYTRFKQLDISRSLDDFSGEARIIVTESENEDSFIRINDVVQICLDEIPVITGFTEKIGDGESVGSHDISYRLRDKTQDIIDSSIPDNVKSITGVTQFKQLCELVIQGLKADITVVDTIGVTFEDNPKAGKPGQLSGDFLQGYARKAAVFLNTDGKGNILIRRPGGQLLTMLVNVVGFNENNIKDSNFQLDNSKRFGKYIVRSGDNVGAATDNDMRATRVFEKIADVAMNEEECKQAAEEEANIRRTRSAKYSCTVAGYSANGELWEPGKFVKVQDDKKGATGTFVIQSVNYSYSAGGGEITTMDCTYSDAYTNEPNPTVTQAKSSIIGSTYTVKKGDTLSEIAQTKGVNLQDLFDANPQVKDKDLIFPDQQINIPTKGGI